MFPFGFNPTPKEEPKPAKFDAAVFWQMGTTGRRAYERIEDVPPLTPVRCGGCGFLWRVEGAGSVIHACRKCKKG
jgi:hypothetical protein